MDGKYLLDNDMVSQHCKTSGYKNGRSLPGVRNCIRSLNPYQKQGWHNLAVSLQGCDNLVLYYI